MGCHYYAPYRSGVTVYMQMIAENLAQRNHKVTVLASRSSGKVPERENIGGVEVIRLPVWFTVNRACLMPSFPRVLFSMAKDFDIVNLHLPMPEIGLVARLLRKKKLVLTYHCDITLKGFVFKNLIEPLYYRSLRSGLRFADAVVLNSEEYFLGSRIRTETDRGVFIYPPIKPVNRRDPSSLRKRLGISEGPVIGFVGRLVYEKGVEYLIEAMKDVKSRFPGAVLVIVGDDQVAGGSVKDKLLALSKKYEKSVIFAGPLDEEALCEFYSLCNVFVLPSVETLESFGMVQVEAMMCGAPVVVTNLPGITVPVDRTGMGVVVPPRDEAALARGIIEVLSNKEKYAVDPAVIRKEFSLEKAIDRYESLFARLMEMPLEFQTSSPEHS